MSPRVAVGRQLTSYAAASVAISLPWPLLLVLAWDRYGTGPHGPLVIGCIGAARMLPYVLLSWAVGTLGDRVRRDRLLMTSLLLRIGCLGVLALAVIAGHLVVAVVAAGLAVACGTPAYPTVAAALPRLAGPASRRATDVLVTIEVAAWVVGPALGGLLLLPGARPVIPLLAVGLTVLAAGLARAVPLPGPVTDRGAREAVSRMLRTVRGTPSVRLALGVGGLLNLVAAAAGVVLLPLAHEVWRQGDQGFGVATAWFGFGALAAPLLWWIRGTGRARGAWGLAGFGLAVVWVAAAPSPGAALPVLGLAGALAVLVECAITEMIQDGVADEHRAGALGLADAVMVCCAMAGAFLGPLVAAGLGARRTLLLAGLACLTALPGLLGSRRRTTEAAAGAAQSERAAHAARAAQAREMVSRTIA